METELLRQLFAEIDRIGERFEGNDDALEALQAIQNWALDETVPTRAN